MLAPRYVRWRTYAFSLPAENAPSGEELLHMSSAAPWKPHNQLLEQLPDEVCERLRRDMQEVELPKDKVLYEVGAHQSLIYFVRSGIVSLQYVTTGGEVGEIAMVGQEGMVGVAVMVDSSAAPSRAVVQIPGEALALKAEAIDREFRRGGPFQVMMLRYTQMLLSQMAQAAICSRHHSIEKQLARWLLLGFDRIPKGEELRITHEAIANLLGVRREGITEAAGRLQDAELIRYGRGRILLLDRKRLESHSCECYRMVRNEYTRLMAKGDD